MRKWGNCEEKRNFSKFFVVSGFVLVVAVVRRIPAAKYLIGLVQKKLLEAITRMLQLGVWQAICNSRLSSFRWVFEFSCLANIWCIVWLSFPHMHRVI